MPPCSDVNASHSPSGSAARPAWPVGSITRGLVLLGLHAAHDLRGHDAAVGMLQQKLIASDGSLNVAAARKVLEGGASRVTVTRFVHSLLGGSCSRQPKRAPSPAHILVTL